MYHLFPTVDPVFKEWGHKLRKFLHIAEPSAEVLAIADAKVQQAMALKSRFDNAHDSAMAASGQALFAEFDQCVHSSEAFPCKDWEHDIHWALSWSSVSADEDVWFITTEEHAPSEQDLLIFGSAWYRSNKEKYSTRLLPQAHHWCDELQQLAPAREGNARPTANTLAMMGHMPGNLVVPKTTPSAAPYLPISHASAPADRPLSTAGRSFYPRWRKQQETSQSRTSGGLIGLQPLHHCWFPRPRPLRLHPFAADVRVTRLQEEVAHREMLLAKDSNH